MGGDSGGHARVAEILAGFVSGEDEVDILCGLFMMLAGG